MPNIPYPRIIPGLINWPNPSNPSSINIASGFIQSLKDSVSGANVPNGFTLQPSDELSQPLFAPIAKCPAGISCGVGVTNLYGNANNLGAILSGSNKPFSAIGVALSNDVSLQQYIFALGNETNDALIGLGYNDGDYVFTRQDDGGTPTTISGGSPVNGQADIIGVTFDGSEGKIYVNGFTYAVGDMTAGTITVDNLALGGWLTTTFITDGLGGKLGQWLFYNRGISSDEMNGLRAYLGNVYGIAA